VPAIASVVPAPVVAVAKPAPPPEPARSWVDAFIERTRSVIASPPASPASYANAGLTTLGTYVTAGVTGSLLGAAHAKFGLDSGGGPLDGWIAIGAGFASIALSASMPGVAAHARAVGAEALTVLAFRKGYEVVKHEGLEGGASHVWHIPAPGKGAGVTREDPIEVAARGLS
jgi:hypothetical protein